MNPFRPDLEAYFERIAYSGPRRANLVCLNAIVAAHVRVIPFENLDILLGRPISMELSDIEHKLVHQRRGGYCFEHNSLMQQVLVAMGFEVRALSARVRIKIPREIPKARTHMFLCVEVEGASWLVDVGVGALSCTAALRLELDRPQTTPHETRRIVATGRWDGFDSRAPDALLYHQVQLHGEWEDIAEFTLEEMFPIDRELGNWFTSTHPASHFKNRLIVSRATSTGRKTLLNREFKARNASGVAEPRTLATDAELLEALGREFALEFPKGTQFDCPALR